MALHMSTVVAPCGHELRQLGAHFIAMLTALAIPAAVVQPIASAPQPPVGKQQKSYLA